MPRPKAPRGQLDDALKQLDAYIASSHTKPGVLNALTKKVEVYQRLHERELDQKSEDLKGHVVQLREQLEQFDGVDATKIKELTDELRTTKNQLENVRVSNASIVTERDDARGKLGNVTKLLQWLAQQVNEPKRLTVAVRAFAEHGKDSKPIVDILFGTGTTEEWMKTSTSRQKLVETFKQHRGSTDAGDVQVREFCRMYLAQKHDLDVEKHLQANAEGARQEQAQEDERDRLLQQSREQQAARQRRGAAVQQMIDAADNAQFSPAPRMRGDLEW
jgi:hypothetical protein